MKALLLIASAVILQATCFGQDQMLSPKAVSKNDNIEIVYGQPSKRDRVVFGELVPYGQVWRTGANEATTIEFKKDGNFGGQPIKKGTYTLFTIPEKEEWTVILNSQSGQWGAFDYDKYKNKDVLRTKVKTKHIDGVKEKFTITLDNDAMNMEWDQTAVAVPYKF